MALTTVIPISDDQGLFAQKCLLQLAALRSISSSNPNSTTALEMCLPEQGLLFLCTPVVQSTNRGYVHVSPLVSVLSQGCQGSLADLASHAKRVTEFSKSANAKMVMEEVKPVSLSDTVAGNIELVVVTSDIKVQVSRLELLVALSPLMLRKGAAVMFKGTRIGKMIGVDLVHVKDADEKSKAFRLKADPSTTNVTIARQVCRERFQHLMDCERPPKVGGLKRAKQALRKLLAPRVRARFRGALLCGPSGSGKTSLLEEVAADKEYFLKTVHCPDLLSSEEGGSEVKVREVIEEVALQSKQGNTVLVLDNIDIVCPRKSSLKTHEARLISALLSCLDRLHKTRSDLVVVGTARDVQDVALSARRFGRLSSEILIGAPSHDDRYDILRTLLQDGGDSSSQEFVSSLASATPGYLGGDLKKLVGKVLERKNEDNISEVCRKLSFCTMLYGIPVLFYLIS